jgi:hypothetical protein
MTMREGLKWGGKRTSRSLRAISIEQPLWREESGTRAAAVEIGQDLMELANMIEMLRAVYQFFK